MAPPKKIPVVLLSAYNPPPNPTMTLMVLVPSLSAEARAQYQTPAESVAQDSEEEAEEEAEAPAHTSSFEVQIRPLEATRRAQYQKVTELDGLKKALRAEAEDPEFVSHAQPVRSVIQTRAQLAFLEKQEAENRAHYATLAEFQRRFGDPNFPNEMKELVLAALATKPGPDAAYFIDAIYFSKAWRPFRRAMSTAIESTEVVLSGKEHHAQFRALHPTVVKKARNLKVVYIGTRTPTTQEERNARIAEIARIRAYNALGHRADIAPPLGMYHTVTAPASCDGYQHISNILHTNMLSFPSLVELVLDLRSLVNFRYTDPSNPQNRHPHVDYLYLVLNAVKSASGFNLTTHQPRHPQTNQLKKLTLLLPRAEIQRVPDPDANYPARHWGKALRDYMAQGKFEEYGGAAADGGLGDADACFCIWVGCASLGFGAGD